MFWLSIFEHAIYRKHGSIHVSRFVILGDANKDKKIAEIFKATLSCIVRHFTAIVVAQLYPL
jgi:hypothetical protein